MTVHREVGDVLAEAGDLTVRRLGRASTFKRAHGVTIERALLSTGAVTEATLTSALSQAYNLPGVSREKLHAAHPDVVACLPARQRRTLRALPFAHSGKELHVAVSDPRNPVLTSNLEQLTGFEIVLHVAPEPVIEDVLDHFERPSGAHPASEIVETVLSPAPAPPPVAERPAPPETSQTKTIESIDRLARALLAEALRFGATELELGTDNLGGFARTFHVASPALTRRLSGALLSPLAAWFTQQCKREGGLIVEASGAEARPERRRVQIVGVEGTQVRLRFAPATEGSRAPVKVKCTHQRGEGFVFCPLCGELL